MGRIIVGVDGSEPSRQALRWAVDEARLRGAELEIVSAWEFPIMAYYGFATPTPPEDLEQAARRTLEDEARSVATDDLTTVTTLIEGNASQVLVARSADADLARGGLAGPWWVRRPAARLGQPALRHPRAAAAWPSCGPRPRATDPGPRRPSDEPGGRGGRRRAERRTRRSTGCSIWRRSGWTTSRSSEARRPIWAKLIRPACRCRPGSSSRPRRSSRPWTRPACGGSWPTTR